MGRHGHLIEPRCIESLQHWQKEKYVQPHSTPTPQMRGTSAKEKIQTTQCCQSHHQTTKPWFAPMVKGKISANEKVNERGALQDNTCMGQVNISTREKYVDLGKSLLIQFLMNSESPFMYK